MPDITPIIRTVFERRLEDESHIVVLYNPETETSTMFVRDWDDRRNTLETNGALFHAAISAAVWAVEGWAASLEGNVEAKEELDRFIGELERLKREILGTEEDGD